ncbi:MAG TPA: MFS transporter [Thermodesulfobacteriota bacterium]|nr:MFS transporter [Thermodesulfobacteriota bacterium]
MLFWGAVYIYMPILSPYVKMVSGSVQSAGIIIGAYGLAQLILRVPIGLLSDGIRRRKPFVLLGFVFDGLAALGLALSGGPVGLFLSVFTAGIAAAMWVPFTILFSSYFAVGQVARSMSIIIFSTRISQITTNYAGGAIAEAWGWVAPFYWGILFSAVGFALAFGIAEKRPERKTAGSLQELMKVGRNPILLSSSISCALMQFATFSTVSAFTPLAAQQIGAGKFELGLLYSFFIITNSAATLLSGMYLRGLFSDRVLITFSFAVIAAGLFPIPWATSLGGLYAFQAVTGVGVGVIFPLLMGRSVQPIPRERQGLAMGIFQSVYAVGMTLGPIVGGIVAEWGGLSSVYVMNGSVCLAGALLYVTGTLWPDSGPARAATPKRS